MLVVGVQLSQATRSSKIPVQCELLGAREVQRPRCEQSPLLWNGVQGFLAGPVFVKCGALWTEGGGIVEMLIFAVDSQDGRDSSQPLLLPTQTCLAAVAF